MIPVIWLVPALIFGFAIGFLLSSRLGFDVFNDLWEECPLDVRNRFNAKYDCPPEGTDE